MAPPQRIPAPANDNVNPIRTLRIRQAVGLLVVTAILVGLAGF